MSLTCVFVCVCICVCVCVHVIKLQGLLSPAIKQWMARARRCAHAIGVSLLTIVCLIWPIDGGGGNRQERKAPQWHVRRPLHQQAGPPPVMPRPPGGLLATLTGRRSSGGGLGGAATEGIRESGLKAANELANSDLRAAMLAVREDGITAKPANVGVPSKSQRAATCLRMSRIEEYRPRFHNANLRPHLLVIILQQAAVPGPGMAPRPPRYTQAQKGGNNHVPGRSPVAVMRSPLAPARGQGAGGIGESGPGGRGEEPAVNQPRPPAGGSPSTSARHSRMGAAPKWAGGAPMPPSQQQLARMAQRI